MTTGLTTIGTGAGPRRSAATRLRGLFRLSKIAVYQHYYGWALAWLMAGRAAGRQGGATAAMLLFLLGSAGIVSAACAADDIAGFRNGSDAINYQAGERSRKIHKKPLLSGALTEGEALVFAACAGAVTVIAGAAAFWALDWSAPVAAWVLYLAGAAFSVQYSEGLKLSYRTGGAETLLCLATAFGLLAPYIAVAHGWSPAAVIVAMLLGLWLVMVSSYSNVNDARGDGEVGRKTLAVATGPGVFKTVMVVLFLTSAGLSCMLAFGTNWPRQTVVYLDKPLDIAPEAGTELKVPALAAMVSEVAGWLHAAGLRRGGRVAIVKENHLDIFLVAAGAARIGALPVLINSANPPEAIRALTDRVGPAVLVAGTTVLARAAAARADLVESGVRVVAVGGAAGELPRGTLVLDDPRGGEPPAPCPAGDDEPMIATQTSGTTGLPKLVVHSAATVIGRVPPRMERFPLPFVTARPRDVVVGALPFAHIRSNIWVSSQVRIAPRELVAIADPSLSNVERMLEAHRLTYLETVPNMFQRWEELADLRPELFARVRLYLSTFDAIHPRTVRKFMNASQARFPVWVTALAQSESANSIASFITAGMARRSQGVSPGAVAAGWPAFVRAKVIDPVTGRKLGRGQRGLLMVSTRARCLTYLGEEERFRSKVAGSWWNTGDLAENLGFGRFRMLDREVDMVPGMSCIELESILLDRLARAAAAARAAERLPGCRFLYNIGSASPALAPRLCVSDTPGRDR